MAYTRDPNSDLQLPPIRVDGWEKGIDNLRKGYDISDGFLRDAINVDISNSGKVKRRPGSTLYLSGANCHSLYSNDQFISYVDGGELKVIDSDDRLLSSKLVDPIAKFAYETVNGETFCTNGKETLKISSAGEIQIWGVEVPDKQPALTETTGTLYAGTYQVVITYVSATGEESGANRADTITIGENKGIALSEFPVPPSNVTKIRVYVSYPDGGEMYLYNEYAYSVTSAVISASRIGPQLRTQFLSQIPAGTDIAYSQGRMFVANGNMVYYTQPLRYGLYNNTSDFIWTSSPVKLIWGAFDGVYIATETQTFFVTGAGTPEQKQDLVLPTGAIPGTKAQMPDKVGEMWMTPKGVVKAYVGGKIDNVSYDKVSVGDYESGAAIIREDDGLRRFISSVRMPIEGTQFATMDFFDAEIEKS